MVTGYKSSFIIDDDWEYSGWNERINVPYGSRIFHNMTPVELMEALSIHREATVYIGDEIREIEYRGIRSHYVAHNDIFVLMFMANEDATVLNSGLRPHSIRFIETNVFLYQTSAGNPVIIKAG